MFERYRRYVAASGDLDLIELFDDVIVEHQQALETTKIYSGILDSAIDHFGLIMDYDLKPHHAISCNAYLGVVYSNHYRWLVRHES